MFSIYHLEMMLTAFKPGQFSTVGREDDSRGPEACEHVESNEEEADRISIYAVCDKGDIVKLSFQYDDQFGRITVKTSFTGF